MWPIAWRQFVEQHQLVGTEIEIPETADLSGVGAVLEILSEPASDTEANEHYPGIVVKGDGFVPVGGCTIGAGDPYFLNVHDRQPGPLYRIYHDSVLDATYNRTDAVAVVLRSFDELLKYVDNK